MSTLKQFRVIAHYLPQAYYPIRTIRRVLALMDRIGLAVLQMNISLP